MRTRLLLNKLGQTEYDRLVDHVASMDPIKMKGRTLRHFEESFPRQDTPHAQTH